MRVRSGTASKSLKDGTVIVKTTGKSIRQLQCPKCRYLCTPIQGLNGAIIYHCKCGRSFSSRAM